MKNKEVIDKIWELLKSKYGDLQITPEIVFKELPDIYELLVKLNYIPPIDYNLFTNVVRNIYQNVFDKMMN